MLVLEGFVWVWLGDMLWFWFFFFDFFNLLCWCLSFFWIMLLRICFFFMVFLSFFCFCCFLWFCVCFVNFVLWVVFFFFREGSFRFWVFFKVVLFSILWIFFIRWLIMILLFLVYIFGCVFINFWILNFVDLWRWLLFLRVKSGGDLGYVVIRIIESSIEKLLFDIVLILILNVGLVFYKMLVIWYLIICKVFVFFMYCEVLSVE